MVGSWTDGSSSLQHDPKQCHAEESTGQAERARFRGGMELDDGETYEDWDGGAVQIEGNGEPSRAASAGDESRGGVRPHHNSTLFALR